MSLQNFNKNNDFEKIVVALSLKDSQARTNYSEIHIE